MDNGELVVDDLVRELAVSRSVFFKKLKRLRDWPYRVHKGNAYQACRTID